MFEVVEIGPLGKKRWFKPKMRPVKLKVVATAFCEKLGRSFEGYGNYSTQKYRADFSEGEVITIWFPESRMLAVGDRLSVETLSGQGCLDNYFRLVATS